ncbi:TPR_REGION domain-containing protein [Azospirillaceae bacterium]
MTRLRRPSSNGWVIAATLVFAVLFSSVSGRAASDAVVKARGANHPDHTRLVFEWGRPINYTITVSGASVRLQFDQPGQIDVSAIQRGKLNNIAGVEVSSNGRLAVTVTVPATSAVHDFRSEQKIVLDVFNPGTRKPSVDAPITTQTSPAPPPMPSPRPLSVSGAAKPDLVHKPIAIDAQSPPSLTVTEAPAQAASTLVSTSTPTAATSVISASPGVLSVPAVSALPTAPLLPPGVVASPLASTVQSPLPDVPTPVAAAPVVVPTADSAPVLTFDPGGPAGAAFFARSDQFYAVFDRPMPVAAGVLANNRARIVGDVEAVPATGGGAFRLRMKPWLRPSIDRVGNQWRVQFVPTADQARSPLRVESQPEFALGARLLISAPGPVSVITVNDLDIGDALYVAPMAAVGRYVPETLSFAQAELIETFQGLVVRPLADGVTVRPVREGVEITSAGGGGMMLSSVDDLRAAPRPVELHPLSRSSAATPGSSSSSSGNAPGDSAKRPSSGIMADTAGGRPLFDLNGWQRGGREKFTVERQYLQQAIVDALPEERTRARLNLVRFYFAHGYAQETLGLLGMLAAEQPDFNGWPEFRAMRGAAMVLAGDPDAAMADLVGPNLDDLREASLWRAAAEVGRHDWHAAVRDFKNGDSIMAQYPDPHFRRLSLLAAEAFLRMNDIARAGKVIDRLVDRPGGNAVDLPSVQYFKGLVLRSKGETDEAIESLRRAYESNDRLYHAQAGLALVNLELEAKKTAPATAADRLGQLRFAWRGDELEMDIIERHGEVQWLAGEYVEGLNTLKEAAAFFPEGPRAVAIAQKMLKQFGELYRDGASKLPAVRALALFDQFRELTPPGEAGDEVVRQLAERLVEIDLLPNAADLLAHQVRHRLSGLSKAEVGARLASIRLLDGKPDLALEALDMTEIPGLPQELIENRRLFQARALADLQRNEEALRVLSKDDTQKANLLRVEIAWRSQRWFDAAGALAKVIGPPPSKGVKLSAETAQLVLNRAVAMALAGDVTGVEQIRSEFAVAMAETAYGPAFRVLTSPEQVGGGSADLASIKSRVAEVDAFQNFLKSYKGNTRRDAVSATN